MGARAAEVQHRLFLYAARLRNSALALMQESERVLRFPCEGKGNLRCTGLRVRAWQHARVISRVSEPTAAERSRAVNDRLKFVFRSTAASPLVVQCALPQRKECGDSPTMLWKLHGEIRTWLGPVEVQRASAQIGGSLVPSASACAVGRRK